MKEEDIRPAKIFEEYLRLAEKDTDIYFSESEKIFGNCPACNQIGNFVFEKFGFAYEECPSCLSLYVNPRPIADAFTKYYTESASSEYWATTFYKKTADARRERLWKPKARIVNDTLFRFGAEKHTLIDIGGGFGLFAEEVRSLVGKAPIVIEPGPMLAASCREKSLVVIEKFLEEVVPEDLPKGPKAFVSFELFEHLHDPAAFLDRLNDLMASGDYLIFTTLSGLGVDIQALWEDSKSITPPHHLNFLNPNAIKILLGRLGYEVLEVTTPGKLDLDIMNNNYPLIKDRFWRSFISTASDSEKMVWQELISQSGWSSHMMAVCRKP